MSSCVTVECVVHVSSDSWTPMLYCFKSLGMSVQMFCMSACVCLGRRCVCVSFKYCWAIVRMSVCMYMPMNVYRFLIVSVRSCRATFLTCSSGLPNICIALASCECCARVCRGVKPSPPCCVGEYM